MERRKFLLGTGALAAGGAAALGSGAFSRVESHRDVTIQVAEDPDAYLGLRPAETPNGQNFAYIDDNGHLAIDVGDFADADHTDAEDYEDRPTGEGVNSNSVTWFDCVFEVRNQGKETAGFYIEGMDGLGTDEGEVDFYVGEGAGAADEGITSIVGLPVEIELNEGEAVCVGIRVNSAKEQDDPLFDDDVTMIADVGIEGLPVSGGDDDLVDAWLNEEPTRLEGPFGEVDWGDGPWDGEYEKYDPDEGINFSGESAIDQALDGFAVDPIAVEISPGTTVEWEWEDDEMVHTLTSYFEPPHESPEDAAEDEFQVPGEDDDTAVHEYTFEQPGLYLYYCSPHGTPYVTDSGPFETPGDENWFGHRGVIKVVED